MYWVKSHSGHLYFIYSTLVVRYQRGNLLCVLCLYIKSVISWLYFRPFLNLWLANDLMTLLLVTVNSFVIILRKKMSINGWFLYDYAFFMLRISISKTCNVSKTGFDHDFMDEILWCIYSLNGSSVMVFIASFACFQLLFLTTRLSFLGWLSSLDTIEVGLISDLLSWTKNRPKVCWFSFFKFDI